MLPLLRRRRQPVPRRGLGWLPDRPDPRDVPYAVPAAAGPDLVESDLRQYFPLVVDQGRRSDCVGEAHKRRAEVTEAIEGLPYEALSAFDVYQGARRIDQPIGRLRDVGCYPRDAEKFEQRLGIAPESGWPFDNLPEALSRVNRRPPARADVARYLRSGGRYYSLDSHRGDARIRALSAALSGTSSTTGKPRPVAVGLSVWESFLRSDSDAVITRPASFIADPIVGGHYAVAAGIKIIDGRARLIYSNSWGDGWRDGGYAYLDESVIALMRDIRVHDGWHRLRRAA